MVATRLLTADDLAAMEAVLGDGRHELIEGELLSLAPAFAPHGIVSGTFTGHLWTYVTPNGLGLIFTGETGFLLGRDPDTIRVPDVAFVRWERLPPLEDRLRFMPIAPDLAVEVISTSERRAAIAAKVAMYLAAGVRLVWVADPRTKSVTLHSPGAAARVLGPNDSLDGGDLMPGFSIRVGDFFPAL